MLCLELLLSSTLLAVMLNVFEAAYSPAQHKFGVSHKVTPFLKSAHNCPWLLDHSLLRILQEFKGQRYGIAK